MAPITPASESGASRLLGQATFGATDAEITRVKDIGYAGWLDAQFAMPKEQSHVDWLFAQGWHTVALPGGASINGLNASLWRQFMAGKDQLRQRVAYALSQIAVTSRLGISNGWRAFALAYYMDILLDGAFGSYRSLLEKITASPAMGIYLTYRGNRKADAATGRVPDENYARELMQLFAIGLYELNADGTLKLANGKPIETYTQEDISGLARVFTGWNYDPNAQSRAGEPSNLTNLIHPMVMNAAQHEPGEKRFLGIVIPPGTDGVTSMRLALDALMAHPNIAPFVSKQLIQRLVTSNPSAAYVGRVAAVFNDNGSGQKGDLKAVVKAILLDADARVDATLTDAAAGKLREPVVRFTQWARAFAANSPSGKWALPETSNPGTRLGQSPLYSPSVFNFYRPGYVPPGTAIAQQNLVAPELQITNESSVAGFINFMQTVLGTSGGILNSDVAANYAEWLTLVDVPASLLAKLNLVLAAGQLSQATLDRIRVALEATPASTDAARLNRLRSTILLVMAVPEYLVQK